MQDKETYTKLKCLINHEDVHDLNYERLAIVIVDEKKVHSIARGFYNLRKNMVTDVLIYEQYENLYCDRMISEHIEDREIKLYFASEYEED